MLPVSVWAQSTARDERQRIERERAQVLQRAREGEAECARRFAVSACMAQVRSERRSALQNLDRQRALLDDEQRKQRAAERKARIEQRQDEQARSDEQRLPPPMSRGLPSSHEPSAAPASASTPQRARAAAQQAREEAEAAQRAAAAKRRVEQAQAHRESVLRRNAERAAVRPPAAPLPVPGAASAASR